MSSSSKKAHIALNVGFPVFSLGFTGDKELVLGGGGGSSRTGVRNRLALYKIELGSRTLEKLDEYEMPPNEDAPMSMAVERKGQQLVCGINADEDKTKRGDNENLRVFSFTEKGLKFERAQRALDSTKPDDYQKVAAFSRDGKLLALGNTTGQFSLFAYPNLTKVFPCHFYGDDEEIYDVDFNDSGDLVLGCSSKQLLFWSTQATEKPVPKQTIENPSFKKDLACTFRAAKFGRGPTAGFFYTVVNAAPAAGAKKSSSGDRKSFVSQWDMETWKLVKTRSISQRQLTAFEVSHNGKLIAYGSSDLSVGVVNAQDLHPILTILRAHDFPATTLRFSPSDDLVVSASADATVRVVTVKGPLPTSTRQTFWYILLIILVVLLGVAAQYFLSDAILQHGRLHF